MTDSDLVEIPRIMLARLTTRYVRYRWMKNQKVFPGLVRKREVELLHQAIRDILDYASERELVEMNPAYSEGQQNVVPLGKKLA